MAKKYLTNDEKMEILSKSNRFTSRQLAQEYGCSVSEVCKIWRENDFHKPTGFQYYVDNNYFSSINSATKAYIVGLIASDGNIYKRDGHQGQLRISLKAENSEKKLLKDVLKDMNATHKITQIKRKNSVYISFTIVSQQIFDDLKNIGIIENKTWDMDIAKVISNIPNEYYKDFFRGYFDGDGSVSNIEHGKPSIVRVRIACTLNSANTFIDTLKQIGISASFIQDKRQYKHDFGTLSFTGYNKYIFLKFLYDNDNICLERKKVNATQYFDLVETNITNRRENIIAVNKYSEVLASDN